MPCYAMLCPIESHASVLLSSLVSIDLEAKAPDLRPPYLEALTLDPRHEMSSDRIRVFLDPPGQHQDVAIRQCTARVLAMSQKLRKSAPSANNCRSRSIPSRPGSKAHSPSLSSLKSSPTLPYTYHFWTSRLPAELQVLP